MRSYIAKYIGYPVYDLLKRTRVIETLNFLRKSQYWEKDKIEEYQLVKLRKLMAYAVRNVPYYEKLFRSIKLGVSDIKKLEDITKIPVLTKEIVRKENIELVARNFNMKYVKTGKTGGTTGAPIKIYKDLNNRSFTWGSYYRWYEWMGMNYWDRTATFWGARTVLSRSFVNSSIDSIAAYLQNNLEINAFKISNKSLDEIYFSLRKFRPVLIKGYLSAMLQLANHIKENSLEAINPQLISTTSETLLPHNRDYLQNVFGAPVYDQYGCGEVSAISYECSKHQGLHINQEHVICEILDGGNEPIFGARGKIVATDLDNYVMPFIRYENGDLASRLIKECTCGVKQPLMSPIDGRATDTITLKNGSKVHGVFFTDILFELGILAEKIQRFQVYQNEPGSIEFRFEATRSIGASSKRKLLLALNDFFSDVNIIEAKHLSNGESGKFSYIISDLDDKG